VTVAVREPVTWKHPELVVRRGPKFALLRREDRCAALTSDRGSGHAYSCSIYEDRPQTCRDFAVASGRCLQARRRVGLSR
jgi:Fe-S-cluster containining protein